MAFNRQQYIDVVLNGHALPAQGIIRRACRASHSIAGLPYDPLKHVNC